MGDNELNAIIAKNVETPRSMERRDTEAKPFISQFDGTAQKAIMIIKPHVTKQQLNKIKLIVHDASIEILREKKINLPSAALKELFEDEGYEMEYLNVLSEYLGSDEFIIWELSHENLYDTLFYIVGPDNPKIAKNKFPNRYAFLYMYCLYCLYIEKHNIILI